MNVLTVVDVAIALKRSHGLPQDLAGLAVRSTLMAGEPVHEGKLASDDGGLLAVMLSPGKRAVAVRITADTTAGETP